MTFIWGVVVGVPVYVVVGVWFQGGCLATRRRCYRLRMLLLG